MNKETKYPIHDLQRELIPYDVNVNAAGDELMLSSGDRTVSFRLTKDSEASPGHEGSAFIRLDQLVREPRQLAAIIRSRLGLNKRVFARNCQVRKLGRQQAAEYMDQYHLMGSTQSAFNLGLYHNNDLLAVASFSKGRKMDRLENDQRSFELIRFCTLPGITVTGGLTKLVLHFCREKKAGDVMTYVDKQFSDGKAFINAGFRKSGETGPYYFLVDRFTFERTPLKKKETAFDHARFYLAQNGGNIKLVYTPGEEL